MNNINFIYEASWFSAVTRGFFRRCPRCGMGKLFQGYLTPHKSCHACELDFENIHHPDDGPAFFTMSIVLFFFVPLLLWLDIRYEISFLVLLLVCGPVTLCITLGLLPLVKGAFIAATWKAKPEHKKQ